jgi:hypothetical protein
MTDNRRDDSLTADESTTRQRALWDRWGDVIGMRLHVPPCQFGPEEIAELNASGRALAYLPHEVATSRNRHLLAELFPRMRSWAALPDNLVANDEERTGWFDYDAAVDAPWLDTTEAALRQRIAADRRTLLNLNQYIVAAQTTFGLTGVYLDSRRTWSRLGATLDGRIVAARFDGTNVAVGLGNEDPVEGSLLIGYDVAPVDSGPVLGARTTSRIAGGRIPDRITRTPRGCRPLDSYDLEAENSRLTRRFLDLGFHRRLGVSATDYLASLPSIGQQPSTYRATLDLPLIVETRIPWREQAALAGMSLSFGSKNTEYEIQMPSAAEPDRPYAAWFNAWDQRFTQPIAVGEARNALRDHETGGSPLELVTMEIAHPELSATGRFYEAIGFSGRAMTSLGLTNDGEPLRTPCIYHWRGRAEIGANLHPLAFSIFRPLVRGRAITTLP